MVRVIGCERTRRVKENVDEEDWDGAKEMPDHASDIDRGQCGGEGC